MLSICKTRVTYLSVTIMIFLALVILSTGCGQQNSDVVAQDKQQYRIIKDMRGKEVTIPENIKRVATISDGLIESTMVVLGVQDKIVGLGSSCVGKDWEYDYDTYKNESFTYTNGMNPATVLFPQLQEMPVFSQSGAGINFETLASLEPDIVLVRVGDCTLRNYEDENTIQAIDRIENMGLPVIVLRSPNCFENPTVDIMYQEVALLGEVFDKKNQANQITALWDKNIQYIKEKTQGIAEQEKTKVLLLGLNKNAREKGGAAAVMGLDDAESDLIERYVHAKNAYRGMGSHSNVMSTEQILAIDPDVIFLPTSNGYHPARELYEGKPFRNLQELKAIQNKRVFALPWTPCNCCIRLEHLVNIMVEAKASYPEKFKDLTVHEWVLDFYKDLYGVDDSTAKRLRSAQWLDWMEEQGF